MPRPSAFFHFEFFLQEEGYDVPRPVLKTRGGGYPKFPKTLNATAVSRIPTGLRDHCPMIASLALLPFALISLRYLPSSLYGSLRIRRCDDARDRTVNITDSLDHIDGIDTRARLPYDTRK